jgi:hypothetical protein
LTAADHVAGTMTHDYKRNGTTTLFAALNMLDGKVIGGCMPRHRHREFLRFLKLIDQKTAADLDLHLIVDNYATHWFSNAILHRYSSVDRTSQPRKTPLLDSLKFSNFLFSGRRRLGELNFTPWVVANLPGGARWCIGRIQVVVATLHEELR